MDRLWHRGSSSTADQTASFRGQRLVCLSYNCLRFLSPHLVGFGCAHITSPADEISGDEAREHGIGQRVFDEGRDVFVFVRVQVDEEELVFSMCLPECFAIRVRQEPQRSVSVFFAEFSRERFHVVLRIHALDAEGAVGQSQAALGDLPGESFGSRPPPSSSFFFLRPRGRRRPPAMAQSDVFVHRHRRCDSPNHTVTCTRPFPRW